MGIIPDQMAVLPPDSHENELSRLQHIMRKTMGKMMWLTREQTDQ